ncbi:hypothetical protein RvY_06938 [Ramazzottius varieornatus]|uniref:Uncharacterized protein n=1 Tax=Ramazzottius varieornatus TaxID=947166 RepID=A0A1D1V0C7_RAMVA|nr:hypothetical protein RvY_06938 [Ramazzottius varieornatus]
MTSRCAVRLVAVLEDQRLQPHFPKLPVAAAAESRRYVPQNSRDTPWLTSTADDWGSEFGADTNMFDCGLPEV